MSYSTSRNSPIYRLNSDILWHIINLNADMFADYAALETTLSTSRVCRDWRGFMLGIPSLWAKLIDLDHLLERTSKYRSEILRRSGAALLWIKTRGNITEDIEESQHLMRVALDVLSKNWYRIQKLYLTIYVDHLNLAEYTVLSLPAPHLES